MFKTYGLTIKWTRILTTFYYVMIVPVIINSIIRNEVVSYILGGISLLAALIFGVLFWFYYNLPEKLNMKEKACAE